MRIPLLLALSAMVSALVAGCGSGERDAAPQSPLATLTTPPASSATSAGAPTATPTSTTPTRPPAAGAPMQDVVRWVEAGTPVAPADYRTVSRNGTTTDLGDGIAFTAGGGSQPIANCVTNRYRDGALACLVELSNPPPQPDGIEGVWKGNWVDFTGTSLEVGSAHGDPGPFVDGAGPELRVGSSLAFGDYNCRADAEGVLCVNYAFQSAVRLTAAGAQPFGCLQKQSAPSGIGEQYGC